MSMPDDSPHIAGVERGAGSNVRQLGSDVLTLAELQADLLQADLREWASAFARGVAALAAALVVLLASAPVALIALGYYLDEATDLSLPAAMLIAAGAGVATAVLVGGVGAWLIKREQPPLRRFRTELRHNVRWLKRVLTHPTTAPRTG